MAYRAVMPAGGLLQIVNKRAFGTALKQQADIDQREPKSRQIRLIRQAVP